MRLFRIVAVGVKFRLDEFLLSRAAELHLSWLLPAYWRGSGSQPPGSRGERVRLAFEELGPVFVKFGQLLSVRPDLIPADMATELAGLRDAVAPFPGEVARGLLEAAYACSIDDVFSEFEMVPVASASIAQVHRARLHNGAQVAVKVVRPDIAATIENDVGLLRMCAILAERWAGAARRLRAVELVSHYHEIIVNELDMLREASSASQLGRNFEGSALLRVPKVCWEHCRANILVLEFVQGIPLDRVEHLRRADIDLRELAERGVEIFFAQVFVHNFFHADMHPGNIFVEAGESGPRYLAVDFGIMGSLSSEDQTYLAENFLAFFNRDYRRVAELHVVSGWVPAGTRLDAFEAAIRSVCEPIFQRPLGEISFALLLVRLFHTAQRFEMQVQPQLLLLQKTLLHIEGLGRQLYPELDLWVTARPLFERWMAQRSGPKALARAVGAAGPRWIALASEFGPRLPDLIARAVRDAERGAGRPLPAPAGCHGGGFSLRFLSARLLATTIALAGLTCLWVFPGNGIAWLAIGLGIGGLIFSPPRGGR